ncbi:LytR family transcriptional regulator [Streptomyces sp. Ru73]|uniref:LCP family protein n=1 Tax=Streptomyces sp. Ru73 TaxID=2080748 RepID=UPI000CDD22AE|nr:LCP family protein [Streptomyces sp. Ru73]POX38846.1 LytR family transcriptional regulator [Streptomyces sp. Ru73]
MKDPQDPHDLWAGEVLHQGPPGGTTAGRPPATWGARPAPVSGETVHVDPETLYADGGGPWPPDTYTDGGNPRRQPPYADVGLRQQPPHGDGGPRRQPPHTDAPQGSRTLSATAPARYADRPSSHYGPRRAHARRPKRRHRVRRAVLGLTAAVLVGAVGTYGWADTKLRRDVDLDAYGHRPPHGKGTNYLIVGSDSRDGLSAGDLKNLHAGGGGGRRTDSMIVLHTGAHGASMVSLPRDSWVTLPGHTSPATGKTAPPTRDKLNAAFSYGGPELLTRTIEYNTGLRIDHYAEIGFAGFVNIVNAIGGVRMCLERGIKDKKSGADLKKGCQTLDGKQALAFVRQRHQEAEGDLGRTKNQQKFLSALAHQAARPGTVLDPAEIYPTVNAGLDTLVVDKDTSLEDLTKLFRAVRSVSGGTGKRLNVPVSGIGIPTSKGSVITWDKPQSRRLFDQLRHDRPLTTPRERTR